MRPLPSKGRLDVRDEGDRAVATYESLCQSGSPSIGDYWAGLGPLRSASVLGALVKVDLQARFDRGERPTVAEYLDRFPELVASGDAVVSLIYEEFCLLEEHGEQPDSARFCELYSRWGDSLHSQLVYHRELSRVVGIEPTPVKFPRPGERFASYQLRSVLGIGGVARVYLATDDDLGGRKVALKVSASVGREPAILANLDHRNIVPILTVAESASGLRGFCMPYRPGVTLEELSRRIGRDPVPRRAGAIWDALKPSDPAEIKELEDDRTGWDGFPARGAYPEAVAWIGLALAQALAYLHGRGVLHRDVKPANVLLAYREGPQLLDFNLAHAPNAPEHAQAALKGGTLPYMAPEQLRAFLDPAAWDHVKAPADLYALGLVLRGLLTGQAPDAPSPNLPLPRAIRALHDRRSAGPSPIRRTHPGVPPALESIIARCLAFDPSDRYAGASDLAEDLRRFLTRQPLKFAANPSAVERAVNFGYRNRKIGAALLVLVAAFAMGSPNGIWPRSSETAPAALRIPDQAGFRRAVLDLDSAAPSDWARARDAFERSSRENPRSAWPWLYLGLAFEKIGLEPGPGRALDPAHDAFSQAARWPDYEDALRQRIAEAPRSATARTLQALRFLDNRADPEHNKKAEATLRLALASSPDRVPTLVILSDVERQADRWEEAAGHLARAIELAGAKPRANLKQVNQWRTRHLVILNRWADQGLAPDSPPGPRGQVAAILDRIEAEARTLDRRWEAGPPDVPELRGYYSDLYAGSVASGRAWLAAEAGDAAGAGEGFTRARALFESASRQLDRNSANVEAYRRDVAARLVELDTRSRKFDRPAAD